ncbi:hypothetical protein M4951_15260 [Blastopirellula sp. J2-11]|uniref:WD40 repeat domain-containing protein n=1 Tax=Blastopirellula sp. J2-11 TaxID=2943192 RepID=UPI0021C83170|nr:hypothetical protein [Blastopirellula sp. J2-11]UUO04744.1 hypothetical protein M4951_15260 [Blastopirellula sp. J2-11]
MSKRIRCPQCGEAIRIASDLPDGKIACASCGGRFKVRRKERVEEEELKLAPLPVAAEPPPRLNPLPLQEPSAAPSKEISPYVIVAGIAAVLLGVVCGAIALGLTSFGDRQNSIDSAVAQMSEAEKPGPTENLQSETSAAKPFRPSEYSSQGNFVTYETAAAAAPTTPELIAIRGQVNPWEKRAFWQHYFVAEGNWNLDIGPGRKWTIAPDLKLLIEPNSIPYSPCRVSRRKSIEFPTMADMQGPFAILPPETRWEQPSYKFTAEKIDFAGIVQQANRAKLSDDELRKAFAEKIRELAPYEIHRNAPFRLMDLRTGEQVGHFSDLLPLCWEIALSLDGTWAISADPVPEDCKSPERKLFVWKKDQIDGPIGTIDLEHTLIWLSFIDEKRLLFLDAGEAGVSLKLWDVETNEQVARLEIDPEQFPVRDQTVHTEANKVLMMELGRRSRERREEAPRPRPDRKKKTNLEEGTDTYQLNDPHAITTRWSPRKELGTLSPDGKHLILHGHASLLICAIPRLTIQGTFSRTQESYRTFSVYGNWPTFDFSADGRELLGHFGNQQLRISTQNGQVLEWREPVSAVIPGANLTRRLSPLPNWRTWSFTEQGLPFSHLIRQPRVPQGRQTVIKLGIDASNALLVKEMTHQPGGNNGRYEMHLRSLAEDSPSPATAQPQSSPLNSQQLLDAIALHPEFLQTTPRRRKPVTAAELKPLSREFDFTVGGSPWTPPQSMTPPTIPWPDAWNGLEGGELQLQAEDLVWIPPADPTNSFHSKQVVLALPGLAKVWRPRADDFPERISAFNFEKLESNYDRTRRIRTTWEKGEGAAPLVVLDPQHSRFALTCHWGWRDVVIVFDKEGQPLFRLTPGIGPVQAVAFAGPQRLLTLADGRLTAWDTTSGADLWEVDGSYHGTIAVGPQARWLAVANANSVDLLTTETGELLSRAPIEHAAVVPRFAISSDGRYLAAWVQEEFTKLDEEMARKRPDLPPNYNPVVETTALVGDLTTQTWREIAIQGGASGHCFGFVGPDLLAVGGHDSTHIYDLKLQLELATGPGKMHLAPNGALWKVATKSTFERVWRRIPFPDPQLVDHQVLLNPDRRVGGGTIPQYQLEVDLGKSIYTNQHGPQIASRLNAAGFKIGPSEWTIRVTAQAGLTGDSLKAIREIHNPVAAKYNIPQITYHWTILNAEGEEIYATKSQGHFLAGKSRYYKGAPLDPRRNARDLPEGMYQFSGDPTRDMAEEILRTGDGLVRIPLLAKFKNAAANVVSVENQQVELPIALMADTSSK